MWFADTVVEAELGGQVAAVLAGLGGAEHCIKQPEGFNSMVEFIEYEDDPLDLHHE